MPVSQALFPIAAFKRGLSAMRFGLLRGTGLAYLTSFMLTVSASVARSFQCLKCCGCRLSTSPACLRPLRWSSHSFFGSYGGFDCRGGFPVSAIPRSERGCREISKCRFARVGGYAGAKLGSRVLAMKFKAVESKFQDARDGDHVTTSNADGNLSNMDITNAIAGIRLKGDNQQQNRR